ncbi:MAG: DUF72 domain-containing protein [Phycisphaerales bacterium]|nr:DUF72 domain-containing protein [Phycisphaerales bacterium]
MPDAQPSLFGDQPIDPLADGSSRFCRAIKPQLAAIDEATRELAAGLPSNLYLGTSSWSFPGWKGIVYDCAASESTLARDGLAAYAQHPLFRSVGVDKTYYRPAPRVEFERLAEQVPAHFRFLVKMWRGTVEHGVRGRAAKEEETIDAFLNPRMATIDCITPAIEGLGEKAGPLLFQFPPMHIRGSRAHRGFLAQLSSFLAALPKGPLYAVELRNRSLLEDDYAARLANLLAENNAVPCLTVHPSMPSVEVQASLLVLDHTRPLVMRWMLRGNHAYGEAKDLYAPFDALVEPDDASRDALAHLAHAALTAGLGVWIITNNKAEGSSPRSVERLAHRISASLKVHGIDS